MRKGSSIIPNKDINIEQSERAFSAVAGYVILAAGLRSKSMVTSIIGGYLIFRAATGYSPVYDLLEQKGVVAKPRNVNIRTSVTVRKSPAEIYAFWRNPENLPLFMEHLEKVTALDDITSEWEAKIPGGAGTISWNSEIVDDQPDKRIGWRSLPDSTIENAGTVLFRDAGEFGTEVQVVISYHAPVGKPGEAVATLLNPLFEKMVKDDIKNLKGFLESGEVLASREKSSINEQ